MGFRTLISASLLGVVLGATVAEAADLKVTIRDVRNDHGVISVALYDREQGFLEAGVAVRSADLKAVPGELSVVFENLAPGYYAAAAFHDENASGDFDTTWLGLPEEGYGFSNGAQAVFSAPLFTDAAVTVTSQTETDVRLSY
jgi:uncharacterized protein (DUF2141 family)